MVSLVSVRRAGSSGNSWSTGSAEGDGQPVEAPQDDPAVPRGRGLGHLEPGQRRAEAVVDAAAEREVLRGAVAAEVEDVRGLAPLRGIAVGGPEAGEDEGAGGDRPVPDLHVAQGDPARHLDGAVVAEEL